MKAFEMGGRKMSCMRWMGIMAAAGILTLGSGGQGYGKAIFQEDFRSSLSNGKDGQILKHGNGYAWRGAGGDSTVEKGGYRIYDIQGLNEKEGTVECDVTRAGSEEGETLFSFANELGENLFSLRIDWEPFAPEGGTDPARIQTTFPAGPDRVFFTTEKGDFGVPYEFSGLPLGRTIAKGQTFHIAFSWGADGPSLYIDGKRLKGGARNQDALEKIIPLTKKFLLGGRTCMPGNAVICQTPSSLIANVQVHDRQLIPTMLGETIKADLGIQSVSHDAFKAAGFSGKLLAGNNLQVTVGGTPGAAGTFDVVHYPDASGKIVLDWRGWGVYLEEKNSYEEGEVNLSDAVRYKVFSSLTPLHAITAEMVPLATLDVEEQSYTVESLNRDTPYYLAVVAEMRDGTFRNVIWPVQNVPLAESGPGVYSGGYTVTYADRIPRAVVVGRLTQAETSVTAVAENTVILDPALTVSVTSSEEVLKADEKSTAQISVTVTDANGNPVSGHKIKFLLATTSQYTGVVGGGAFTEQVGGAMQESAWGVTDLFGKLTATYVAGFAAKTAVIVARDMTSNSTGAAYVTTYIQAFGQIELTPVEPTAAMDAGYAITVTSSDEWLTADGKSQARITARVTLNGQPVKGHTVSFNLSSGNGSIRTVSDTTDARGEARAVYTAGKKIGIVLISATDTTVDISASVQIELRSDAPAKITIKIDPEKLPADGRSRADIEVLVTDINDNPNDNTKVEYTISQGSGDIKDDVNLTDKNGISTNEYTAGRTPGIVSISLVVRSTIPTAEELVKARNLSLAVPHYAFR